MAELMHDDALPLPDVAVLIKPAKVHGRDVVLPPVLRVLAKLRPATPRLKRNTNVGVLWPVEMKLDGAELRPCERPLDYLLHHPVRSNTFHNPEQYRRPTGLC